MKGESREGRLAKRDWRAMSTQTPLGQPQHRLSQRLSRTARASTAAVGALLLMLLMLTACSTSKEVARDLVGAFKGERGKEVLVIHPGKATREELLADVRPVIKVAAEEGATVKAFVLRGGAAAAMTPVRFSDAAGGGSFMPASRNQGGQDEDARAFEGAAMADIEKALGAADPQLDATGADLAGAVIRALDAALKIDAPGAAKVTLITGGGVHQASDVDLVKDHVTPANAAELARLVPAIDPKEVIVELVGIGRFPGIAVNKDFADGVIAWWRNVCNHCTYS